METTFKYCSCIQNRQFILVGYAINILALTYPYNVSTMRCNKLKT